MLSVILGAISCQFIFDIIFLSCFDFELNRKATANGVKIEKWLGISTKKSFEWIHFIDFEISLLRILTNPYLR